MALYNLKNPAVKRLMREAEELREPTEEYWAEPLEDNLFDWHFTLRGPPISDFDGGIYHGRITLPPEYPMKPPSIILLTPNGRFEVNKKICLSISGHHPETWQPSWSIRTALLALIGFFPTHGNGAIGSLDYTPEERKQLAIKSQNWKCPECGYIKDFLKKDTKLVEKNSDVLDATLQKEYKVTQPIPLDGTGLLQEEKSGQENQSFSNINHLQSNGFESHAFLPQSANLVQNNASTISLPRNRFFTLDQEINPSQSFKLMETKIVPPDEIKCAIKKEANYFYNFFSLLVIWVIVVILGILIARRLLY